MQFEWTVYNDQDAKLVDSWLDKNTVKATGLDEDWQSFYDYWTKENLNENVKSFCYIISEGNKPFAVIFLAVVDDVLILSEFIVAPEMRDKGYGLAVICDLINNYSKISVENISCIQAVIFPGNKASKKVFEKAGFMLVREQDEGDALDYEYKI